MTPKDTVAQVLVEYVQYVKEYNACTYGEHKEISFTGFIAWLRS